MAYISVLQETQSSKASQISVIWHQVPKTQHIASLDIMRSKILIIMNVYIVIVFQRHKLNSIFGCELNKARKRVYSIS